MTIRTTTQHVNVKNPLKVSYINGDETTEGGIRIVVSDDLKNCVIERRVNGLWRKTGVEIDAASLFLGSDLSLEAFGNLLSAASIESGTQELHVAAEFDDLGSKTAKVPILGLRLNRVVVVSNTEDELVTTLQEDEFVGVTNAFRYAFYFKTGSVAATSSVTLQIRKGGMGDNGSVFFSEEIPTSEWAANTEVRVELEGGLNITPGNTFTTSLFSDNNFSLLGKDLGGGLFLNFFAFDIQTFEFQTLISTPDGTDRFLTDLSAAFISDSSGNLILSGEQVEVGN